MKVTDSAASQYSERDLPFRQVAQDLPTPCWISDAEGSIIWVNTAWVAYTGMDVEAIRTQGLERLHDPDLFPAVRERWADAKLQGAPAEMVFPLRGRDGKLRPFLTRVVPVRDSEGVVRRWFGTNTDITVQSDAEARLLESQHRLELATQAAQLGVWDWDLVQNTFVYSARARDICGFPQTGDITYEHVAAATHPEDYPRTSGMAQRAFDPAIKLAEPYHYRIVRPDGEIRWVLAHGRAVFAREGGAERAVRYVGTLQDVTEHVQLEQSLKDSEALLRSLFDASELYIAVLELTPGSFRYILANKATAEFYGQPPDSAGFDAREIGVPAEEVAAWRATLLEIWTAGAPRTMEYSLDIGRGPGWYVGTYTPLPPGPDGEPRISLVVIDVTARKEAEERQTLLMREVDHRARNVLAVAQAIVQLTKAGDVSSFKRSVQGRIASLARAHTLLAADRWSGADLKRLIEEELAPYGTERPSRLKVAGPSYALEPASAQSVALVIHELATNAAKHGSLARPEGDLVVTWDVNASGLKLVWQEVAAWKVAPDNRRGFGFTMLEQSVVRQLGGQWAVDWTSKGLACTIFLPAGEARPVGEEEAVPRPARNKNVLIVEDEPLIALALEQDLTALGYASATAASLGEADALAADGVFSLVVLDLNLAGESTVDFARELKSKGATIIFCTGYQAVDLPPQLAGSTVLVKPVQRAALAEAITMP